MYLDQPRSQILVYDDVVTIQLKTVAVIDHHILASLHFTTSWHNFSLNAWCRK